MEYQYKRRRKQSWKGGQLLLMEGLASEAKLAHAAFPVGTMTKPLTYA